MTLGMSVDRGFGDFEMGIVNLRMKVDPLGPLGPEQASFIANMKRQVRSEKTMSAYMWGLKHFRGYMRDRGLKGFEDITREFIEEWQDHLATNISPLKKRPLAPRSQGLAVSGVRMLFTWAAIRDKCDAKLALWFQKVKVAPLEPRPLKHDAMLRIRHFFIEKAGSSRICVTGRFSSTRSALELV